MGVYIEKPKWQPKGHNKPWFYSIHGHFICEEGRTWSKEQTAREFCIGEEYSGMPPYLQRKLIDKVRSGVSSSATLPAAT
jgi:hypothetical protein